MKEDGEITTFRVNRDYKSEKAWGTVHVVFFESLVETEACEYKGGNSCLYLRSEFGMKCFCNTTKSLSAGVNGKQVFLH